MLNVKVIESVEELRLFLVHKGYITLDTETYLDQLILLSLGDHDEQFIINCVKNKNLAIQALKLIIASKAVVVGHNLKYDLKIIYNNLGIHITNTLEDTFIGSIVLTLGLEKKEGYHSLENLSRLYVNPYAYTNQGNLFHSTVTKDIRTSFGLGPLSDEQLTYAALDIFYTSLLHRKLSKKLWDTDLIDTFFFESQFVSSLYQLELNGIPISKEKWLELHNNNLVELENFLNELNTWAQINWNSPLQVKKVMIENGINISSVSQDNIAHIDHPLVKLYIQYKEKSKEVTTYGKNFIDKYYKEGYIYPSYYQILTTGRMSSSDPNIQNIPRKEQFRSCFQVDDGYIIKADYSQMEARALAVLANEPLMLSFFNEGKDFHTETAKRIFQKEDITKEERSIAKSVGFAILFGGGPQTIERKYKIPADIAKKVHRSYLETFKVLHDYFIKGEDTVLRQFYITIDPLIKRKSFFQEKEEYIYTKDPSKKNALKALFSRRFKNYRPQGTCASITKLAIMLFNERKNNVNAKIIACVHDEIVVYTEERPEDIAILLKECMEEASSYFLNGTVIPVETQISKSWK